MAKYAMLAMTKKGGFPLLLFGFLVEPFRVDDLLLQSGIHHPSCLKFFIRHPHHSSFPKSLIGNPNAFKYFWTPA